MLEEKLKNLIIEKYGSVRQFSFKIDIPYTTVDSILKRGIDNSNVGNVIKMCKALDLSLDSLIDDKEIVFNLDQIDETSNFSELDNALFSKAKELSDEDKIVVMNVIDSIKRNIDNENK